MQALENLKAEPDLILLDINIPGMDGLQLCKTIRDEVSCPILFLSARDAEQDKINGLLIGGDDYITKPFSLPEVAARIAAHLRRETRVHDPSRLLAAQELLVNLSRRTVHFKGTEIEFSKREFDILELLLTHAGQVFDRERIYETVWGLNASGDSGVVKEHIRKIRQKLQSVAGKDYIETVWGGSAIDGNNKIPWASPFLYPVCTDYIGHCSNSVRSDDLGLCSAAKKVIARLRSGLSHDPTK